MATRLNYSDSKFQQLGLMRDVLELVGRIRQIQEPITSPGSLRQTIELVLHFAQLLGLSTELTDRLRQILADENVFQIVLATVRFVLGELGMETADGKLRVSFAEDGTAVIEPQDFLSWLPIAVKEKKEKKGTF
jgi:hypothetical protein